jgi:hypothetical protein
MESPASRRASLFTGGADDAHRSNSTVVRATGSEACFSRLGDAYGGGGDPMVSALRFGRKVKISSTAQIKHQLLMLWLKDQTEKEAAEAATSAGTLAAHFDAAAR